MDYVLLCKNFFGATNIPIFLLKNGQVEYSAMMETLPVTSQAAWRIYPTDHNPGFCGYSPDLEYGRVQIENTDYDLIIGPAFSVPVTNQLVRQFMHELTIPLSARELLTEFLCAIPRTSHLQLCKYLAFLHLCLNHKETNFHDLNNIDIGYADRTDNYSSDDIIEYIENNDFHNSYYFELEMYQYIREGNTEQLKSFLYSNKMAWKEGKMAHTPMRHYKNFFIGLATKIGILGAIPGGMDIEKTYQLIDFYVQKCEYLLSIEEINKLYYIMIMDFCQRVHEAHIPKSVTSEIYQCMDYIRNHTNEPISIDDVSRKIYRSNSYTMKHFKEELGISISAYITKCRLEDAKRLLAYSDKSLAEISSYLCFSSQAYFQNVFKKQYGTTPLQYRKKEHKAKASLVNSLKKTPG